MSPRSEKANARIRRAAREKILEASLEVFAERGFRDASLQEIARRAGVSKGLPYHYFDSKKDLLEAALAAHLEGLLEVTRRLDACDPPGERLAALVDGLIARVEERPTLFRLYLALVLEPDDGALERAGVSVRESTGRYLREVEALFGDIGAVDPAVDAAVFRSTLLGICFRLAAGERELDVPALWSRLLSLFTRAPETTG